MTIFFALPTFQCTFTSRSFFQFLFSSLFLVSHISFLMPLQIKNTCYSHCPSHMYKNTFNVCKPCASDCVEGPGQSNRCSGPANRPGSGGCNYCSAVIVSNSSLPVIQRCFSEVETKLHGHYSRLYVELPGAKAIPLKMKKQQLARLMALVPCNPRCLECSGDGSRDCRCRYFKEKDNCVFNCSGE